jgi:dihydrofolate reductase
MVETGVRQSKGENLMRKYMSMSLDGFIAGPNDGIERPLGDGGERLHDWIFGSKTDRTGDSPRNSATGSNLEVMDESFKTTGAIVMGRRWFDIGVGPWGDHPPFQVPCFVVTHHAHEKLVKGATSFTFVTDGIASALEQAQAAAGDKNVAVGGANIAQQYLKAGLLDEIQIHLVPILLGQGRRLFDQPGTEQIELESTRVIESPDVTHLRFSVEG